MSTQPTSVRKAERVLAIDPALRSTGYAVLERSDTGKLRAVEYGTIKNKPQMIHSACLVSIRQCLAEILDTHKPDSTAVEGVIFVQSYRTAITLGSARGAAMIAIAERGVPIYEYAPRRVKQAVVGRGGAAKTQVAFMVRTLLGLTETPPPDAADALAIGLAHFQNIGSARGELHTPIQI